MPQRDELIAVARTYLQEGLLDHQPDKVLFAEHCERIEMGYQTGGNAQQLRELLKDPAYEANKAMTDEVWVVEAPYADVRYTLELHGVEQRLRIASRFKIVDGLIEHIEIIFNAGELQQAIIDSIQPLRTDL